MKKGISLIVLVITIIVMIILATSVMITLTNTGVINKADEAVGKTNFAQVQQYASLVWAEEYLNNKRGTQLESDVLDRLDEYKDKYDFEVTDNGINVTEKGEWTGPGPNWNVIIADATANPDKYKHPDQTLTNDIGIGTDGEPVNLDLWGYAKNASTNNELKLKTNSGSSSSTGYLGGYTAEGAIIGKMPQYIKLAGETEFSPVRGMDALFVTNSRIKIAPEIPTTITSMANAFTSSSITVAPPEIPDSVVNMQQAFTQCRNLVTPPAKIGKNVDNMAQAFTGCVNLNGEIEINANPSNINSCFAGVAATSGAVKLYGSSTMLADMIATASGGNVSLK